jgi:hypothetical protein
VRQCSEAISVYKTYPIQYPYSYGRFSSPLNHTLLSPYRSLPCSLVLDLLLLEVLEPFDLLAVLILLSLEPFRLLRTLTLAPIVVLADSALDRPRVTRDDFAPRLLKPGLNMSMCD